MSCTSITNTTNSNFSHLLQLEIVSLMHLLQCRDLPLEPRLRFVLEVFPVDHNESDIIIDLLEHVASAVLYLLDLSLQLHLLGLLALLNVVQRVHLLVDVTALGGGMDMKIIMCNYSCHNINNHYKSSRCTLSLNTSLLR
jgi:hypothetical protein